MKAMNENKMQPSNGRLAAVGTAVHKRARLERHDKENAFTWTEWEDEHPGKEHYMVIPKV